MVYKYNYFIENYITYGFFFKSLHENELIIFIDAYNLLLLKPLDDIEN